MKTEFNSKKFFENTKDCVSRNYPELELYMTGHLNKDKTLYFYNFEGECVTSIKNPYFDPEPDEVQRKDYFSLTHLKDEGLLLVTLHTGGFIEYNAVLGLGAKVIVPFQDTKLKFFRELKVIRTFPSSKMSSDKETVFFDFEGKELFRYPELFGEYQIKFLAKRDDTYIWVVESKIYSNEKLVRDAEGIGRVRKECPSGSTLIEDENDETDFVFTERGSVVGFDGSMIVARAAQVVVCTKDGVFAVESADDGLWRIHDSQTGEMKDNQTYASVRKEDGKLILSKEEVYAKS